MESRLQHSMWHPPESATGETLTETNRKIIWLRIHHTESAAIIKWVLFSPTKFREGLLYSNRSLEQTAKTQSGKQAQGMMVALVIVEAWRWEDVVRVPCI